MDDQPNDGQPPVQRPEQQDDERFNPFRNEEDMFKIVLWVGGVAAVVILLVVVGRAVL